MNQRLLRLKERGVDMRGAENDESEMSFRRGYEQGVIDVFYAIERFLDPATREVLQAWIEKDVSIWRVTVWAGRLVSPTTVVARGIATYVAPNGRVARVRGTEVFQRI